MTWYCGWFLVTPPGPGPIPSPAFEGGAGTAFFFLPPGLLVETGVPGTDPSSSSCVASESIFFLPLPVPGPPFPPRRFLPAAVKVDPEAPGTSRAVEAVTVDKASSSAISSTSIESTGFEPASSSSPGTTIAGVKLVAGVVVTSGLTADFLAAFFGPVVPSVFRLPLPDAPACAAPPRRPRPRPPFPTGSTSGSTVNSSSSSSCSSPSSSSPFSTASSTLGPVPPPAICINPPTASVISSLIPLIPSS